LIQLRRPGRGNSFIFARNIRSMKIALLGTKGIPNNYGGFEQFAEYLSVRLAARGHQVTVYNPSFHPYESGEFKGVKLQKVFNPEKWFGGAANFIYDHLCLSHALKQDYDIIYEAGYHSVAASYRLLNVRGLKHPVILTNMDGIEWRRSKWNAFTRSLIRKLEAIAVRESPHLVSDNPGIRQYYLDSFKRDSYFIPYGADPVYEFDDRKLAKYEVEAGNYFMLIARMEPENNIDLILQSYVASGLTSPFIVIGSYQNGYGKAMFDKYASSVRFIGGVYDKAELDSLRHFAKAYFHGHSVGGTNPSLLEAMSCRSFILAHDNSFNRGVLGDDAVYFTNSSMLTSFFLSMDDLLCKNGDRLKEANFQKIVQHYDWEKVTGQHEELFKSLLAH
jgi:glycosyltransferase involved in cell wall biosynthesis